MSTLTLDKLAVLSLANALRKSKDLPVKNCREQLSKYSSLKVDVFSGLDLKDWFSLPNHLSALGLSDVSNEDLCAIVGQLASKGYMHQVSDPKENDQVEPVRACNGDESFDVSNYYAWDYKPSEFFTFPNLFIIFLGVAFIAGFNYWPRWVIKLFVNFTMSFFVLSLFIYLLRFVVFAICYCFGYNIWLFPNIDASDNLTEALDPRPSIEKAKTPAFVRYAILGLFFSLCTFLISQPKSFVKFSRDQKQWVQKFVSGKYLEEMLDQRDEYLKHKKEKDADTNFVPGSNIHYDNEDEEASENGGDDLKYDYGRGDDMEYDDGDNDEY